ncbi:methionine ABC transporter permease [Propionicicella superfundia]|uniref:methionine ABC transporter permease n=1 Tax=Propionicicella superfundia TaxID=348582 RepID=UPI00040C520F|nr:ABC transporter permease subunit [Propionicicella superfundia]
MDWIEQWLPNAVRYWPRIVTSLIETLQMVGIALAFVVPLGVLLGILLLVVAPGHLYENRLLDAIVPRVVNLMRSIPFVIMIAVIIPFTRLVAGTAVGVPGAVVPIIVALVPFVARQVELALADVDRGVIDMALSLGFSRPYVIGRVLLKEGRSGIVRALVLSSISLVGYTAMAGVVGGGGIGDLAIRYGYARFMPDITLISLILLLVIVFALQGAGNLVLRRTSH